MIQTLLQDDGAAAVTQVRYRDGLKRQATWTVPSGSFFPDPNASAIALSKFGAHQMVSSCKTANQDELSKAIDSTWAWLKHHGIR